MSQTPPTPTSHSIGSNYRLIFDSALEAYEKKTGKDLTSDPLLHRLETCHSPDDILNILQEHISGFDQFHTSSDGLTKWLNPTVNVLYTFSAIIGSLGLVSLGILKLALLFILQPYPPVSVIFTGIGVLFSVSVFELFARTTVLV
jgi:fungal STAND N-terminal Goodbye domain